MTYKLWVLNSVLLQLNDWLGDVMHEDKTLSILQMSLRAGLIFFLTLLTVRLAGRRAFGMQSPFDTVVSLLLGATLSRAIVGATSFVGVLAACGVLVVLHRLLAWLSVNRPAIGVFINGQSRLIYSNGNYHHKTMQQALVSKTDLDAAIRQNANVHSLTEVSMAYLEPNGEISVVKKEHPAPDPTDGLVS